ncbi:MAG: hypothetical protein HKP58_19390 [Desulfatitalea sp.]|nr:hypothetical protein [Desulfatitalea sp.]NNK02581.1 hypothetical protein [Desulfatitalea sp.]
MSANLDTIYLPVVAPKTIKVQNAFQPRGHLESGTRRPRVFRIPPHTSRPPVPGLAYGSDGILIPAAKSGKLIDIYV